MTQGRIGFVRIDRAEEERFGVKVIADVVEDHQDDDQPAKEVDSLDSLTRDDLGGRRRRPRPHEMLANSVHSLPFF